jgi:hypothetical protein
MTNIAIRTYRVNRFAEIEGNNVQGWRVLNFVTGIFQPTVYATFDEAKSAAQFVGTYYRGIERKAGW